MSDKDTDNAGVIARPPFIYLGFFLSGVLIDTVWPVAIFDNGARFPAAFALIATGVVVVALGMREFRKAETSFHPNDTVTTIIETGPFRFSRNPLYLSLTLIYVGVTFLANNPWALALLAPLLAVMHYGVIAREERYLERAFGAEYVAYKSKVRRWL